MDPIRTLEFGFAIFSHPSVVKFIYFVLTHFRADNFKEDKPEGSRGFGNNGFSTSETTQSNFLGGGPVSAFGATCETAKNRGFGQTSETTKHGGFGGGPTFGATGVVTKSSTTGFTGFGVSSPQTNTQHNINTGFQVAPRQNYIYKHEEIERINKCIFQSSAYYSQSDTITGSPRVLFLNSMEDPMSIDLNHKKVSNAPVGYTRQDDHLILSKFIIGLKSIPDIIRTGKDNQLLFDFHLFLSGFETLLKEYVIPEAMRNKSMKEKFTRMIDTAVLIAFGNEFKNTPFSFLNYVLMDKEPKTIEKDIKILDLFKAKLDPKNISLNGINIEVQILEQFLKDVNIEHMNDLYKDYNYV